MEKAYDTVIIGTSPVCMIEALYLHLTGKKVALIDQADVPGGAWRAIETAGLSNVDIGCHIMNYDQKAFDFLQNYLNVRLIEMRPQPRKLAFGMSVPYDSWKFKLICFIKDFFPTFYRKDKSFSRLFSHLKSIVSYIIRPKMIYLFPEGGASNGFVMKIYDLLKKEGIEIQLQTEVKSYEIGKECNKLVLSDGDTVTTKELVVSTGSWLPEINEHGTTRTFDSHVRKTYHLLLVVEDPEEWDFEYYQVWRHPIIDRVNNYTPYVKNEAYTGKDVKAMVALVNLGYDYKEGDDQKVLDYFKAKKVVGPEASLLNSTIIPYVASHRLAGPIEEINQTLEPHVRALVTNNLAYSLNKQIERWTKVLPQVNN